MPAHRAERFCEALTSASRSGQIRETSLMLIPAPTPRAASRPRPWGWRRLRPGPASPPRATPRRCAGAEPAAAGRTIPTEAWESSLIRKSQVTEPAAGYRAEPGWWRSAGWRRSGGGVEGHRVAELLQFTDVLADFALGVGPGVVVVRAEVDELGLLVGEQRPDDDQDRAADRDNGAVLAAASGDPPIALAEEGVGAGGADRGFAEHPGQVAVAVAGAGAALRPAGGLGAPGGGASPGGEGRRGREPAHVGAELGRDHLRGDRPHAGDRIELGDRGYQLADLGLDAGLHSGDV